VSSTLTRPRWLKRLQSSGSSPPPLKLRAPARKRPPPENWPYVRHEIGAEVAGISAAKRSAANSLARLRWFAPIGMGIAERSGRKSLATVS
jgi:hypothetical protein